MVAGLSLSSIAANNTNSLFRANEIGLQLDAGYIFNDYANTTLAIPNNNVCNPSTAIVTVGEENYNIIGRLGGFYFPYKYLGAEVNVPIYTRNNDVEVNTVSAGLLLRATPLNNVALYAGAGSVYQWEEKDYNYYGKVGAELRLNRTVGVFTEGEYEVASFDQSHLKEGRTIGRVGIRLVF